MRRLVPYEEFTGQMLHESIRHAHANIERLAQSGHPRADWSIRVLSDNIVTLHSHLRMFRGLKP